MSAYRVVMVRFVPGATREEITQFQYHLQKLAEISAGLVQMVCGNTAEIGNESQLSVQAPDATYGDFASIWEFETPEHLAAFIDSPSHHSIAKDQFQTVVDHRYVFNLIHEPG